MIIKIEKHYHIYIYFFQPSTPTKPVVFADWLAGVSPPDPNTINKHVYDMVEVSQIHVLCLERHFIMYCQTSLSHTQKSYFHQ